MTCFRNGGLFFHERRALPLNLGALTEQSSGTPPPHLRQDLILTVLYIYLTLQGGPKRKHLESESGLLYDLQFTANQFVLVISPLRPTSSIFLT
jgi:hypothetical protein